MAGFSFSVVWVSAWAAFSIFGKYILLCVTGFFDLHFPDPSEELSLDVWVWIAFNVSC